VFFFFDQVDSMRMGGGIGMAIEDGDTFLLLMKPREAQPSVLLFRAQAMQFNLLFAIPPGTGLTTLRLGDAAQATFPRTP
jgi:hypothetical protein